MGEYYHIDRAGSLNVGQTIELKPISINTDFLGPFQHATDLFGEGVSMHGLKYINEKGTPDSHSEWFLEYVRRSSFNDRPSRFQSIFAFSTLEDISRFKKRININEGKIYLIEGNSEFKGDMNMVGFQQSPLLLSWLATLYWSGCTNDYLNNKFGFEPLWEHLLTGEIQVLEEISI